MLLNASGVMDSLKAPKCLPHRDRQNATRQALPARSGRSAVQNGPEDVVPMTLPRPNAFWLSGDSGRRESPTILLTTRSDVEGAWTEAR